jgi:hypothetical protein
MPTSKRSGRNLNKPSVVTPKTSKVNLAHTDDRQDIHHELDPEVMEAISKKKKKQTDVTDYIPELERGTDLDILDTDI